MKIKKLPSGNYNAQVYLGKDANGKKIVRSVTGKTKQEVLAAASEAKQKPKESKTVGEAMDELIAAKRNVISPTTLRGYVSLRKCYYKDIIDRDINSLTSMDIQRSINEVAKTNAPKTVRNIHGFLVSAIRSVRPEFTPETTLPQKQRSEIRIPTETEMEAILNEAKQMGEEVYASILLAAYEGMRRGEIAALRKENIDLKKFKINVCESLAVGERGETSIKTPKTTAGKRTVKLFPPVIEALQWTRDVPKGERVFSLPIYKLYDNFLEAQKRAGIAETYRFHDLRHFFVSLCISLNIPKKYIADFVGHENETMIDRVYAHIMEEKKNEMQDRLDAYFSAHSIQDSIQKRTNAESKPKSDIV